MIKKYRLELVRLFNIKIGFFIINILLYFFLIPLFEANKLITTILFLLCYIYVFLSFYKKTIYFEKFLSIFLWFGFSFKISLPFLVDSFGFTPVRFSEIPSQIQFSVDNYNDAVIYSIVGFCGFLTALFLRKKYIFNYDNEIQKIDHPIKNFYIKNSKKIIYLFIFIFLLSAIINLQFEIYQKGINSYVTSFLLINIFKWLMLMGFTSYACFIVFYEYVYKDNILFPSIIFVIESFFSNTSILSRSYIFHISILFLTLNDFFRKKILKKIYILYFTIFFVILLLFLNIFLTQNLRNCLMDTKLEHNSKNLFIHKCFFKEKIFEDNKIKNNNFNQRVNNSSVIINTGKKTLSLLLNRWVGFDSLIVIMSKKNELNFNLYKKFLGEKKSSSEHSYYEDFFLEFESDMGDRSNQIFLPGYIAYQSISGSKLFVFISCFFIALIGSIIEKIAYRTSFKNFIFSGFISYVLVFRIIHFGYIPLNSLIYLFVILFTIYHIKFINFLVNKLIN